VRRGTPAPPPDPDDAGAAEASALRILAGADQSSWNLQRRLRQRGYSPRAVAVAVERCSRLGYVDDRALASAVAARLQRTGHGRARVAAELRARGVGSEATASALAEMGDDDTAAALVVGRKLLEREHRRGDDQGARRRVAAGLERRGFTSGVIAGTLRTLSRASE